MYMSTQLRTHPSIDHGDTIAGSGRRANQNATSELCGELEDLSAWFLHSLFSMAQEHNLSPVIAVLEFGV